MQFIVRRLDRIERDRQKYRKNIILFSFFFLHENENQFSIQYAQSVQSKSWFRVPYLLMSVGIILPINRIYSKRRHARPFVRSIHSIKYCTYFQTIFYFHFHNLLNYEMDLQYNILLILSLSIFDKNSHTKLNRQFIRLESCHLINN